MSALMVPLDGSTFAEQALPLALAIAHRSGARLHLVTVRTAFAEGPVFDRTDSYLRVLAGRLENTLAGRVTAHVLNVAVPATHAQPPASSDIAVVLARHARDHDVELITMTTHGHGGLRRAWLGSVADSLSRMATRPVLLVRPLDETFTVAAATEPGIRHVLITLDGSAFAEQAITPAGRLGSAFDARYTLLRVVSPLAQQLAPRGRDLYWAAHESPASRVVAEQYLEATATRMRAAGLSVATDVVESTVPATAIMEYARGHGVDIIAMTTVGAGGVKRLLLGSVADKLVRSAETPVLVCNGRRMSQMRDTEDRPMVAVAAPV